jgi:hypothetical protein
MCTVAAQAFEYTETCNLLDYILLTKHVIKFYSIVCTRMESTGLLTWILYLLITCIIVISYQLSRTLNIKNNTFFDITIINFQKLATP